MPTSSVAIVAGGVEIARGDLCCTDPLVVVETVARLALAARRHGWVVRIQTTEPEVRTLVESVGLAGLVEWS